MLSCRKSHISRRSFINLKFNQIIFIDLKLIDEFSILEKENILINKFYIARFILINKNRIKKKAHDLNAKATC